MTPLFVPVALVVATHGTAATPPPKVPEAVFTLKQPTKYKLPKAVQNMIMFALKQCPEQATVWRDEYTNIYQRKNDLRQWVGDILPTAKLAYRDTLLPQLETQQDVIDAGEKVSRIDAWIEWNRTGW